MLEKVSPSTGDALSFRRRRVQADHRLQRMDQHGRSRLAYKHKRSNQFSISYCETDSVPVFKTQKQNKKTKKKNDGPSKQQGLRLESDI